jgi:DNA-binding CsgD family transcriptional regulator
MLTLLLYLVFILSAALASGGIILSTKLRTLHQHKSFSTLLYYQVFTYTFGFYGIWGLVAIRAFLSAYISPELLGRLSDLAILMGLPFLFFSWLMLIQFSFDISGNRRPKWFPALFLIINFILLLALALIIKVSGIKSSTQLLRNCFLITDFIYVSGSSLLLMFPLKENAVIHEHDRKLIGMSLPAIMCSYSFPLLFYTSNPYIGTLFIFLFFAGNTFLPLYLSYCTLPAMSISGNNSELTLKDFYRKFEVSPRESDIVREICNGLSNKEISDKLFISLQTVKDHTHRIYIKTNVRSRVQLINLVRELGKN